MVSSPWGQPQRRVLVTPVLTPSVPLGIRGSGDGEKLGLSSEERSGWEPLVPISSIPVIGVLSLLMGIRLGFTQAGPWPGDSPGKERLGQEGSGARNSEGSNPPFPCFPSLPFRWDLLRTSSQCHRGTGGQHKGTAGSSSHSQHLQPQQDQWGHLEVCPQPGIQV